MYKKSVMFLLTCLFFVTFVSHTEANYSEKEQVTVVPDGFQGIYTAEDLNNIRNNVNGNYILMNDINLSKATSEGGKFFNNGVGWKPIGTEKQPFKGTINGNGYKIIGMKINIKTDEKTYAGLFGYGQNPIIENVGMVDSSVTVENTSIYSDKSDAYAGAIIGYITTSYSSKSRIHHSYNTGTIKATSMFNATAGGLVGYAERTEITESYNTGNIHANKAGGIIGELLYEGSTIISSHNEGKITGKNYAGGLVAYLSGKQIQTSINKGEVTSSGYSGGIVGHTFSNTNILHSKNEGNILGGTRSGGIAGNLGMYSTIQGSSNHGDVTADSVASGITGYLSSSVITDSYNTGHIISITHYAGGITMSSSNSTIQRTYNTGNIEAEGSAAGITTVNNTNSTIKDSFNIGSSKAKYIAGGIVGTNYGHIENTYNVGNVETTLYYPSDKGGIVGRNHDSGTVVHNYYLNTINTGIGPSTGMGTNEGTSRTTFEEFKDQTTFTEFDFNKVWTMNGNGTFQFPELKDNPMTAKEELLDIVIKKEPDKGTYIEGEQFDITGTVISTRTTFGNQSDIKVTADMVSSSFNPSQIGSQLVRINYQDKMAFFYVRVVEKDRIPPNEVSDLKVESTTDTVEISFTDPTDADFVTAKLYVYDEYVGEVTDGFYVLENLSSNTQYPILVTTVDDLGNESKGVSITAITQKSFIDKLRDRVDVILEKFKTNIGAVKLWDLDTAEEAKDYVPVNHKEELEQHLDAYKKLIKLKDLTDVSPTLQQMESTKILKIDFNIPIDPDTVIKDENVFIRHQAEFVEGIDIQVAEDGKSIYIYAPENGYPKGKYSLYVDTSVKTPSGKNLKNPIVVRFEL